MNEGGARESSDLRPLSQYLTQVTAPSSQFSLSSSAALSPGNTTTPLPPLRAGLFAVQAYNNKASVNVSPKKLLKEYSHFLVSQDRVSRIRRQITGNRIHPFIESLRSYKSSPIRPNEMVHRLTHFLPRNGP